MSDFTSHQSEVLSTRQPRGSYAKLICLNCRARKIKCNLPGEVQIEPSQRPQSLEQSCTRCQQQGLDCVVDTTILGRPAQKRRRPVNPTEEERSLVSDVAGKESELDLNIQDFVLSDLRDEVQEIDAQISKPARTKPSKREVFESLMDSTHLFSALMARDEGFGSLCFAGDADLAIGVTRLVDGDLTMLMDEHLIWQHLHCPHLPTLSELRQTLLIDPETSSRTPTKALFVLLCLIALEVPSTRLQVSATLWQQLQSLANHECQMLLFNIPVHKHALLALELVDSYKPLAVASSCRAAAVSIKGNLSRTLGKRTAQRLGLDTAADRLEALLRSPEPANATEVRDLVLETLQWCRWLMLESIVDGYVMKSSAEQVGPLAEVRKILAVVKRAVDMRPMEPAVLFMYHHLSSASVEMQAAIAAKQHWLDLPALAKLIDAHDKKCEAYKEYIDHLLANCDRTNNPHADEETKAIKHLRVTDLNSSHVRIAGLSIFYGLMSGLQPSETKAREITPDEAVQVSSEIINNLKTKHDSLNDPASIASFVSKYGDPRFARQEQILKDFISTADTLSLNGMPYTPPSVPTVSFLLQVCREIVENNSTRLKGWGGMHPNVDVHVILLQDVARRLDGMDRMGGGSDAIAKGSIHAAGAKLIRSLSGIMAMWRKTIIEQEFKDAAAKGMEASIPAESEDVDTFLSGDLLDGWNEWPRAEDIDFSELLTDGLEWVDWAQLTSPSEITSIG